MIRTAAPPAMSANATWAKCIVTMIPPVIIV
jgi:hypothetical protein